MWRDVPDIITCAKFQNEILRDFDSTGGQTCQTVHYTRIFMLPKLTLREFYAMCTHYVYEDALWTVYCAVVLEAWRR